MHNIFSFLPRIRSLLIFAFPIILGNLGQMLIGAGDVFVAARHGSDTVAAISIANAVMTTVYVIGFGLLLSISPVLSKKRGEKSDISSFLKITLLYSLFLALIFGLISLLAIPIIPYIGFEKKLIPYIQDYISICSFSFIGAYIYQALKEFMQAYERVFFANLVSIIAIFLNLFLNWIFVFGNDFIPSLGVNGLAISSLLVRSFMGLTLLIYCRKFLKAKFIADKNYLKELFKIGYPISLSILLECSAFSISTMVAGKISTIQVATHNIVLTLASITFMVPLAISNALSVKVGYAYGARNYKDLKENIFAGLSISLLIMCGFASMFLLIPETLIGFFSNDKSIILTGASLLFIVALFQIFDGTQITISGVLRGLGYTKQIMKTMVIGYWIIGIPIGVYLCFIHKLEIYGLWIGLAIALFACTIIFSAFLTRKLGEVKLALASNEKEGGISSIPEAEVIEQSI